MQDLHVQIPQVESTSEALTAGLETIRDQGGVQVAMPDGTAKDVAWERIEVAMQKVEYETFGKMMRDLNERGYDHGPKPPPQ